MSTTRGTVGLPMGVDAARPGVGPVVARRAGMRFLRILATLGSVALAGCGPERTSNGVFGGPPSSLESICVDEPEEIPAGALRCDEERTYECGVDEIDRLYVVPSDLDRMSCGTSTLTVSDEGPYELGANPVDVSERTHTGTTTVCTSTITLVDTQPPEVEAYTLELWPPNHRMVEIAPTDCATVFDACAEDDVDFAFTYVAVDEPKDGRGDGNFAPDVRLDCDGRLRVRAERAGPRDGRVYRIGFEAHDGNGNRLSGECFAEVPKSQAQPAIESAEVYRVEADDLDCEDDGDGDDEGDCDDDEPRDDCNDEDCGDGDCECDDDDGDDDRDDRCRDDDDRGPPHRGTVNTGPLPAGCVKLEGRAIGSTGLEYAFGGNSVIIDGWTPKRDDPGDYIAFEYTLTSTPTFLSVKAGRDVFTDWATDTSTQSWSHPGGDSGPSAKGISNVVFCAEHPFVDPGPICPPDEDDHDCPCDDDDDDSSGDL